MRVTVLTAAGLVAGLCAFAQAPAARGFYDDFIAICRTADGSADRAVEAARALGYAPVQPAPPPKKGATDVRVLSQGQGRAARLLTLAVEPFEAVPGYVAATCTLNGSGVPAVQQRRLRDLLGKPGMTLPGTQAYGVRLTASGYSPAPEEKAAMQEVAAKGELRMAVASSLLGKTMMMWARPRPR